MPRKLRLQYPGAIYHLMNRGDRREKIFKDDQDRRRFLETLGQACEKTKTEWDIPQDSPAGRRHFSRCMEHRRKQESPKADWRAVERGWFLGDPEFKAELLAQVRERRSDHYGTELPEADALHAERVLRQELQDRGWAETTLSVKQIAARFHLGSPASASLCLLAAADNAASAMATVQGRLGL